ncbi:MAG: serpin family protein [bacterium]
MNKTAKALFIEEKNYIYSPISLYMALAMLAEGAEGETLDEILALLEIEDFELMRLEMQAIYEHNRYANEDGTVQMANSIWIKNEFPVKNAYLDILANRYFAEAYGTEFDDTGAGNIVEWINTNTHDLLQLTKENYPIDPNLALLLLNTVYFDNKWEVEFDKTENYLDDFDETIEDVEYMKHTVTSRYYQGAEYEIVFDLFKNGNSIQYILPGTGTSVATLLEADILSIVVAEYQDVEATISVPKFSTQSKYSLNETLESMGCSRMFSPQAEFGGISDRALMVSFVKQDAGIELSEAGVKAAAVSSIGMVESSINPNLLIQFVLDRPFIYVIYDSNDVPLFVGVMNNPLA